MSHDATVIAIKPADSTRTEPVLGHVGALPCPIDLGRLMSTRMLITAASGGGKSYALRRLLEQTHGQVQQIVIDPEGELVTLAEHFDFLVCAADSADAPIRPGTGAATARAVFRSGRSAIVSLGEFEVEDMQAFVGSFIKAIMSEPQEYWHYALLAVDEAQIFAPQQDKAPSKKPMIDLACRGRKRGLCPVAATQRLSLLHKGVAAQLENKIVGLTTLDLDVARAADVLGMGLQTAKERLRRLKPGEFVAYGPALTYDLKTITIGPVITRHGALGNFADHRYEPLASREDLAHQLREMAEAADRAQELGSPSHATGSTDAGAKPDADGGAQARERVRVARVRWDAIAPLLDEASPSCEQVRARARTLGIAPAVLRRWLMKFDRAVGPSSLEPVRLSAAMMSVIALAETRLSEAQGKALADA